MTRQDRFDALFAEHYDAVHRYATRQDSSAADDISADTFVIAWQRLDAIPPERERPWLLTTARNVASTRRRTDARRVVRETTAATPTTSPDIAQGVADADTLSRALAALTPADRELLLLVAWDGLTPAEAAQVLGVAPGTARVRLSRARTRFEKAYQKPALPPTAKPAISAALQEPS
jgi:RNA polymerase sigma-70 factor (ECF subfamily)